jgi:DNA-binding phage protein
MKTAQKLKSFDITRHLDSEEAITEYLSQVLEDGDNDELIRSLSHIAKIPKVIHALGLKISVHA